MVLLGIKQFRDPYYQGFAAQLSFYYTLSLVPIVILISQVLGVMFGEDIKEAIGWILNYSEGALAEEIVKLLSYKTATALNLVFIVVALWAASRAQFSMMRIANYTFTDGRSTGNGYWRERFRAILNMTLTILTVIFALLVLVYGEQILQIVLSLLSLGEESAKIWLILRWPISLGLYFLMISYNYYVLPSKRRRYRDNIPGTIFASVGLLLVTFVYSTYVTGIAKYDIIYGSLASVVALLFWFYFLAWVMFLGILMNKVWSETGSSKDTSD